MRTVREEPIVTETIDLNGSIYPYLEEAYDALKWWLSRVPESGELLDDINWIYKQAAEPLRNIPAMTVVYTFDSDMVMFHFLLLRVPTVQ